MNYTTVEGDRKNSTVYAHNGYLYTRKRAGLNHISLRCKYYKPENGDCKGTGKIDRATDTFEVTSEHTSHQADGNALGILQMKSALKRQAEESSSTCIRDIHNKLQLFI